jgi:hypothetical protein
MKIYDKSPPDDSAQDQGQGQGRGKLVGVARQIGELIRLDVKFPGKIYRARGSLFRKSFGEALGMVDCLAGASGKLYLCFH